MYFNKLRDQSHSLSHRWPSLLGAVCTAALLASIAMSVQAQSFTGSISGTVTDPAGAVLPNATVTLTAMSSGQTRTATTNSAGEYNFSTLPPGAYKIRITASGFSAGEVNAQLTVAQEMRANAQLKIGPESESVQIFAGDGGVAVETQNAELSNVVNQHQVAELPLITRNPYDLITLSAGATDGPDRGSGNQRGSGFAVNGLRGIRTFRSN